MSKKPIRHTAERWMEIFDNRSDKVKVNILTGALMQMSTNNSIAPEDMIVYCTAEYFNGEVIEEQS